MIGIKEDLQHIVDAKSAGANEVSPKEIIYERYLCQYENGDQYSGSWKGGKWHGKGFWRKSTGNRSMLETITMGSGMDSEK